MGRRPGFTHSAETLAKISAARKRAWADPEVRQRMSAARKRAWAKKAVKAAGLPQLRRFVDRAAALYSEGEVGEAVIDALRQEFKLAA